MGNGPRQVTVSDRSVLAPPRAVPSRSINGLWGSACGARVVRASRAQIALAWVEDEAPGIVVELDLVQVELDQIGVTARPDQHWTTRVSARLTIAERVHRKRGICCTNLCSLRIAVLHRVRHCEILHIPLAGGTWLGVKQSRIGEAARTRTRRHALLHVRLWILNTGALDRNPLTLHDRVTCTALLLHR